MMDHRRFHWNGFERTERKRTCWDVTPKGPSWCRSAHSRAMFPSLHRPGNEGPLQESFATGTPLTPRQYFASGITADRDRDLAHIERNLAPLQFHSRPRHSSHRRRNTVRSQYYNYCTLDRSSDSPRTGCQSTPDMFPDNSDKSAMCHTHRSPTRTVLPRRCTPARWCGSPRTRMFPRHRTQTDRDSSCRCLRR